MNDREFYKIVTSLMFNLIYVFESGEIAYSEIFGISAQNVLSRIYQESISNDYKEIIGDIIDILITLIQHARSHVFNKDLIHKIKLSINFYFDKEQVVLRLLSVIKDLTIDK